jgi:hypothetical protein
MGPKGYFLYIAVLLAALVAYALYRMTQRAAPAPTQTDSYTPVSPSASPMAVEFAQEIAIEAAQEAEETVKSDES